MSNYTSIQYGCCGWNCSISMYIYTLMFSLYDTDGTLEYTDIKGDLHLCSDHV